MSARTAKQYEALKERSGIIGGAIIRERTRVALLYVCVGDFTDKKNGAIVALATVMVGVFTFTLWRATTRLWETSQIHADHMERSIVAMSAAERRQLRAYVGVYDIRFNLPHLSELAWKVPDLLPPEGYIYTDHVLVTVKNFGRTPAYELRVTINWQPVSPFGIQLAAEVVLPDYVGNIAPSESQVLDGDQTFTATIIVRELLPFQAVEARAANLFVYGNIFYTDVYGRRWRREYCYQYEPWRREGERFVPHTGHNDETYAGERSPKLPA